MGMASTDLEDLRWAVETLRWAKAQKAAVKEAEEKARAAVEEALGDNDSGSLDGHVVITWKTFKRTALNQQVLKAAYPEAYENSKTTTETRRFEIVDTDE